jgi:hypothetical protein
VFILFNALVLRIDELLINLFPWIETTPNAAELSEWSKVGALQFVEIMMKLVTAFDEIGSGCLHC